MGDTITYSAADGRCQSVADLAEIVLAGGGQAVADQAQALRLVLVMFEFYVAWRPLVAKNKKTTGHKCDTFNIYELVLNI